MPRIFDNIDRQLLPALRDTMAVSTRADFCVGYFNLRGWKAIADLVERWPGGDGGACRLLVGMQKNPDEELREALRVDQADGLDTQTAIRRRRQLAQQFREQLTFGVPTNADEVVLQRLARQLRERKVVVKLFLRHGLHAKLYMLHRDDKVNPMTAFVGSSNLTFSGLEKQGELNVDVLDHDACAKLSSWFEARWSDKWCVDISEELIALIICPKNLVPMWEDYRERYRLRARVLSLTRVRQELPGLRRYKLVIIDESHNLRNREGSHFRAIQEYVRENESKCVLLSATPYNKSYLDLSSQLRLFLPETQDLGVRPEALLRSLGGEPEFARRHQVPVRSLAAFERSESADDWRDLMRLYLVRRTRSFILQNYAKADANGRKYLPLADGTPLYFLKRVPKTLKFDARGDDPYARLYSDAVVDIINDLSLPRYGLGNYEAITPHEPPTQAEVAILGDLSRAGQRLMGFCRTNLFKRLESSGFSFLQSVERHLLRNQIYLHALENGLPLPIGPQDVELLDSRRTDEDIDDPRVVLALDDDRHTVDVPFQDEYDRSAADFRARAARVYDAYTTQYASRFKWLRSSLFVDELKTDLASDCDLLMKVLRTGAAFSPESDPKLNALEHLLTEVKEKVLVFTQFADTVEYLERELTKRGIQSLAGVTGQAGNATELAWRFSPVSNAKNIPPHEQLRVLIATDVLSEGQNLQDAATVVNFDLPWAAIRLVQRAGRVDRIGQKADRILCYSFLPADGVEQIIRLRGRVRQRLRENAEVVGTDEAFFEDDEDRPIVDLYNENEHVLDWRSCRPRNAGLRRRRFRMPRIITNWSIGRCAMWPRR